MGHFLSTGVPVILQRDHSVFEVHFVLATNEHVLSYLGEPLHTPSTSAMAAHDTATSQWQLFFIWYSSFFLHIL